MYIAYSLLLSRQSQTYRRLVFIQVKPHNKEPPADAGGPKRVFFGCCYFLKEWSFLETIDAIMDS